MLHNSQEGMEFMLDYDYVNTCTDKDILRAILDRLMSGQSGHLPGLTKHIQARLLELEPERANGNAAGREVVVAEQQTTQQNRRRDAVAPSPLVCHALRLEPGEEIKSALLEFATERGIKVSTQFLRRIRSWGTH
ncbi:unnamed protein product [Discosporangium mesarthrocarpum]